MFDCWNLLWLEFSAIHLDTAAREGGFARWLRLRLQSVLRDLSCFDAVLSDLLRMERKQASSEPGDHAAGIRLRSDVGHCAIMLVCRQCPVGILRCVSNYFDWTWIDWIAVVRLLVQGYSWSKELLASADLFCASGDLLWMYCCFQKGYWHVALHCPWYSQLFC